MEKYFAGLGDIRTLAYEIYKRLDATTVPVFVCVGSDKFVCDSLAPIVAEILKKKYDIKAYIYGGLDYNITAQNLTETLNYISTYHEGAQVIVIDATLGDTLGEIKLTKGCYPALGTTLPKRSVGDFSILGVVGKKGGDFNLNSTRLKVVVEVAGNVAKAIYLALSVFSCENEAICIVTNGLPD